MQQRNSAIDFLKGISILLVLITHYAWTVEQRTNFLFPYVIDMAVPVFMIISGCVGALSFKKHKINSLSEAYEAKNIIKKVIRYTIPFIMMVIWQIIDPNVIIYADNLLDKIRWLLNGTVGSGSYYYPILLQLAFVFPLIYFIIEKKEQKGLWICLEINAVYELLKWSYGMNDECYRLLIFRYVFVIASGVYTAKFGLDRITSVILTIVGGGFLWITTYGLYAPRIITSWTSTCFIAVMWIIPATVFVIRNVNISFKLLEFIGHASYNIFLVQMVYYRSYRTKVVPHISQWKIELLVGILICLVIGYAFYMVESKITEAVVRLTVSRIE